LRGVRPSSTRICIKPDSLHSICHLIFYLKSPVRTPPTGLYEIGDRIRTLTVKETLQMFGFDVSFRYTSLKNPQRMLFYLGNSIVVNVLEELVKDL